VRNGKILNRSKRQGLGSGRCYKNKRNQEILQKQRRCLIILSLTGRHLDLQKCDRRQQHHGKTIDRLPTREYSNRKTPCNKTLRNSFGRLRVGAQDPSRVCWFLEIGDAVPASCVVESFPRV